MLTARFAKRFILFANRFRVTYRTILRARSPPATSKTPAPSAISEAPPVLGSVAGADAVADAIADAVADAELEALEVAEAVPPPPPPSANPELVAAN